MPYPSIVSLASSPLGDSGGSAPAPPLSADADVLAFLGASGVTDAGIADALTDFVTSCKANSCWSNWHVIYPFVGGTADFHSYNLARPGRNRITWSSAGVTHNANGVAFNGTTGYADTGYCPTPEGLTDNSSDFWFVRYVISAPPASGGEEGGYFNQSTSPVNASFAINPRTAANAIIYYYGNTTSSFHTTSTGWGSKKAYHHAYRNTATPAYEARENGNTTAGPSAAGGAAAYTPVAIGAIASGGFNAAVSYGSHTNIALGFWALGRARPATLTNAAAFRTAVETLMADLGRTVTP